MAQLKLFSVFEKLDSEKVRLPPSQRKMPRSALAAASAAALD